jgi:hypothetical protein
MVKYLFVKLENIRVRRLSILTRMEKSLLRRWFFIALVGVIDVFNCSLGFGSRAKGV